jgi:ribosomal protein L37E
VPLEIPSQRAINKKELSHCGFGRVREYHPTLPWLA